MNKLEEVKDMCELLGLVDKNGDIVIMLTRNAVYTFEHDLFNGDSYLKPLSTDKSFVDYSTNILRLYTKLKSENNKKLIRKPHRNEW